MTDDLTSLKDDMIAFIEGHGMRRFHGYVPEEAQSVLWNRADNPDSWKDFVELAKSAGAPFLTMNAIALERNDYDDLVHRIEHSSFLNEEDLEEARWLRPHLGKTGFIQLGFPYQGVIFLCEVSCEWYERYQRLLDYVEDVGGPAFDESDLDDEH